jgi:hypothetical protein
MLDMVEDPLDRHDRVDRAGQLLEGGWIRRCGRQRRTVRPILVRALRADRGQERQELLPPTVPERARAEHEPEEGERHDREPAAALAVLAVHNPGLGRMHHYAQLA